MMIAATGSVARAYRLVGVALALVLFACVGCQLETEPDNSSFGEITSFDFSKADNAGLPEDAKGSVVGSRITINVPAESDVTSLVPTIRYLGAGVSPASGSAQDFTDPVTYIVTTPEGRERVYTVTVVKAASSSKEITHFLIDGVEGTINGTDITLIMPFGTNLKTLRGSIIHTGARVSPDSGSAQDFSEPVEYTVTARDGTTATYTVTVSVAESDAKDIIGFAIGNTIAEINGTQITISLPHGTDLRELAASVTHTGLTVSPESGSQQDFREPVQYIVTAADGTTQLYTVLVSVTADNAKAITRFSLAGRTGTISGTAISVTLPFGTNVESLAPSVQHTGKSLSPASSVEQDFREPVVYTVMAADGSTAQYTVTVTVAPNNAKEITSFVILGNSAQIDGTNITLTLPAGTPTNALVPTITYAGASVLPPSGVARNFNNPVSYVVTAADGTRRTYEVTVTVAASNAKAITEFRFGSLFGDIQGDAITVTVPFAADVTALAPTISHTGASVEPASGQARNFTAPQTYTVTAQDGTTRVYTVTVMRAASSAKDITSFSIGGTAATINGTAITITVPFGTNRNGLAPMFMHTGASVSFGSGVARDFRQPVTYTVTAADGTTQVYTVTVSVAPNSAKNITSFTFQSPSATGTIDNTANTVAVTVPFGTNRNSLTPNVMHEGVSISPMSGTAQNFSAPVMYTVTADDDSTKVYTVTVTVAAGSSAKEITSFAIAGVQGMITGTSITLTLPAGTSRTSLMPTISISALATIDPAANTARDFTNPVNYRVTAQDGTFTNYTVTVNVAPSTEKNITMFTVAGVTAPSIGENTISVTVPNGTDLTALSPTISVSPGATIMPASGESRDFTAPVMYTVRAEDNSTKVYTVTVTAAP